MLEYSMTRDPYNLTAQVNVVSIGRRVLNATDKYYKFRQ